MINRPRSLRPGVVCLAAGKSQLIVIRKAKELGYAVLAVDQDPEAPGFALSDERIVLSTYRAKPIIKRLRSMQNRYRIVGVLNRSSGLPVVTAAEICEALMLPGSPPHAARTIVDKSRLMAACAKRGIATPVAQVVRSLTKIDRSSLHFPCVVKPALSVVGRSGVSLVAGEHALPVAFAAAAEVGMNGIVNIEEYIPGRDLSLMALVLEGRLRSIILRDELNVVDSGGRIRCNGIAVPSVFSGQPEERAVIALAKEIVDSFGLDRTVINMSCRCEPGGVPKLVEIHLDMGGDLFYEALIPESASVDVLAIVIRALVGELPDLPHVRFNPAAVIFAEGKALVSDRTYDIVRASDRATLENAMGERLSMTPQRDFCSVTPGESVGLAQQW